MNRLFFKEMKSRNFVDFLQVARARLFLVIVNRQIFQERDFQ